MLRNLREATSGDLEAAAEAVVRIIETVRQKIMDLMSNWGEGSTSDVSVDLEIVAEHAKQLLDDLKESNVDLAKLEAFVVESCERLLLVAVGRSEGSVDGALKTDPLTGQVLKGLSWYGQQQRVRWWGGSKAGLSSNYTQPFSRNCLEALQWFGEIAGGEDAVVHSFKQVETLLHHMPRCECPEVNCDSVSRFDVAGGPTY